MSTVAEMIAALETYPGEAEVWLEFYDGEAASLHVHPGDTSLTRADIECHVVWDGYNTPEVYRPTITVYEDWEL